MPADANGSTLAPAAERRPVTVVTGCSRGIGLALAEHLAADLGHVVVATLRDVSNAPPALAASGCLLRPLDVTDAASVAALFADLAASHGGVDVVVNNAGYGVPGTLESIPLPQQQALFDANVWGVVRVAQAALPQMRARGGGVFLSVSSVSGARTLPGGDAYGGSKRALEGMLDGLRYSVARDAIRVAVVNPGPVDTGFLQRFRDEGARANSNAAAADNNSNSNKKNNAAETKERNTWSDWLSERTEAVGQSARGCAEAIAQVIEREWKEVGNGDKGLAQFWNGTDAGSQKIVDDVFRFPDGRSGPYAEMFKVAEQRLEAVAADKAE